MVRIHLNFIWTTRPAPQLSSSSSYAPNTALQLNGFGLFSFFLPPNYKLCNDNGRSAWEWGTERTDCKREMKIVCCFIAYIHTQRNKQANTDTITTCVFYKYIRVVVAQYDSDPKISSVVKPFISITTRTSKLFKMELTCNKENREKRDRLYRNHHIHREQWLYTHKYKYTQIYILYRYTRI